jgi:prepilin-type processing-associated H-X9-DG protein/prepilin-type N-terminal cleavage/methylation domain-containing protein
MYRRGLGLVELLLVLSILSLLAALLLPALARTQEAARRASCQNNLRQWGMVFKMYAGESRSGMWPPLQAYDPAHPALLAGISAGPRVSAVYPEYLPDPNLALCPSSMAAGNPALRDEEGKLDLAARPALVDASYVYLGYLFDKTDRPVVDASAFPALLLLESLLNTRLMLEGYRVNAQLAAALEALAGNNLHLAPTALNLQRALDTNIVKVRSHPGTGEPLGNGSSGTIFRLREGIERFGGAGMQGGWNKSLAQSEIWVMFDHISTNGGVARFNHVPGGANVLYMDGHVHYVAYVNAAPGNAADSAVWNEPVSPSVGWMIGELISRKPV